MISTYIISAIRTLVPLAIGTLLTWLASSLHIVIDPSSQAGLVALCTAVLSGAWYLLARWLEQRFPQAGWLLGAPSTPHYPVKRKAA